MNFNLWYEELKKMSERWKELRNIAKEMLWVVLIILLSLHRQAWAPFLQNTSGQLLQYAWNIFATLLQEMVPRSIKLVYCLTRKTLKSKSLVQNICSSERDMSLQKQISLGSSGTQTLYFWRPILLEKWQKDQILCISLFSC